MVTFQPNMQVQDDLAALFSRNLSLNNVDISALQQQQLLQQQQQQQQQAPKVEAINSSPVAPNDIPAAPRSAPIVYSISQHYHHSAHTTRQPTQTQEQQRPQTTQLPTPTQLVRPSSEPPIESAETLLVQHGVDPTALSSAQLQLFRIADDAQKLRLTELWRICPPERGQAPADNANLTWTSTTLEREEMLARMRFDEQQMNLAYQLIAEQHAQQMEESRLRQMHDMEEAHLQQAIHMQLWEQQKEAMSLDGTSVATAQPQQADNGRWLPHEHSEPYMMSGYQELMRREADRERERYTPATDPVYRGGGAAQSYQMQLENQYGAFEHFRGGQAGTADAMEIL